MKVVAAIILMTLVTYGARVLPMLAFSRANISGWLKDFMELVPVALLAALVIPELVMPAGRLNLVNPFTGAAVVTFLFAKKVPNLFLGIFVGMLSFWGLDKIIR